MDTRRGCQADRDGPDTFLQEDSAPAGTENSLSLSWPGDFPWPLASTEASVMERAPQLFHSLGLWLGQAPQQSLPQNARSLACVRGVYFWSSAPGWLRYRWALRDHACLCAIGFPSSPQGRRAPLGPAVIPGLEGSVERPLAEIFAALPLALSFQKSGH